MIRKTEKWNMFSMVVSVFNLDVGFLFLPFAGKSRRKSRRDVDIWIRNLRFHRRYCGSQEFPQKEHTDEFGYKIFGETLFGAPMNITCGMRGLRINNIDKVWQTRRPFISIMHTERENGNFEMSTL